MRLLTKILLGTAMACCMSATAGAQREALLVSTSWLAQHLSDPNLVILHMGDPAEYAIKHIPGARLVSRQAIAAPTTPGGLNLELPEAAELKTRLEALGISDHSRIVVVFAQAQVTPATRVVLTLHAAGLGSQTSFLDGGFPAWERDGKPVTADVPPAKTGTLAPLTLASPIVDADFVTAHLATPGYVIIDARDPGFYSGAQTGGSQAAPHKAGHIPGARNIPYSTITNTDLTMKSADALQSMFDEAGVTSGDTVVAYCHIGQQATAVVFAARTLGITVKLYDGSFEDWSKRDKTTIK